MINDIEFIGRQDIKWEEVEKYLKRYVDSEYRVLETADVIYVGTDFPSELKGSNDTKRLKGANARAKANAVTKLPELIYYATNKRWQNYKEKHGTDAKFGWYRFTTRFALPVYDNEGELLRYNISE